jgi:chloramphenicol 3-O-phosphotransferase
MTSPETIRASSSDVRAAFAQWLVVESRAGIKLVILEGLTLSGKTTLTKLPFDLDGGPSTNIEMDDFLPPRLSDDATTYLAAIDQSTMLSEIEKALRKPSLVILQGAIVWPAAESVAARVNVRRVYLKRMMHLLPDYWADEDFILDPEFWPPTGFHRSIYRYHAEQRPWLKCDLIIERIEQGKADKQK